MPLSMQQVQALSQRLIMTPQMQQSIKLLQMNTIELEALTQEELLENPFLEMAEEDAEPVASDGPAEAESLVVAETPAPDNDGNGAEATTEQETAPSDGDNSDVEAVGVEEQPEQFTEVDVDWGEEFDGDSDSDASRTPEGEADWAEIFSNSGPRTYSPPADDSDERSFEETVAGGTSLYDRLMWQLRVSSLQGVDADVAAFLIGCIDEKGYLETNSTLGECAKRHKADLDRVEDILNTIEANTSPSANIEELTRFIEDTFEKKNRDIALDLAGYLAVAHARPGSRILQRKPTMEACVEEFGVRPNDVERVLMVIQEFDPAGVGARDLPECLILQLAAIGQLDLVAKESIQDHWTRLLKKQFKAIARTLKVGEEEVREVFKKVQRLNPSPGLTFTKEQPVYITPDVFVREMDGHYTTYMHEGEVAGLRLSNTYKNILLREDTENQDPKEREYALEKYRSAVMFIKNVEKRRNTVLRVTEAIMDYQREFLDKGVEALRPLALSEIADRVGMHESTISRVTSNKYVDTPQGLFELKYFFSSAIRSSGGEAASSRAIKSKIQDLIADENPRQPLSDDKIAKQLASQGFSIARRTVAKYREQMKILPTNLRRQTD